MLTTEKTLHPLIRHGTTQRERLLKALAPENLQLDNRSIADVLAFAGKYAEQIRYWSSDNQPDGNWACFWTKDTTALFAVVAATDTDDLRMRYRNTELEFIQACKVEKAEGKAYCENAIPKLYDLIALIFEAATTIQGINSNLPDKNPLKSEMLSLISKLGIGKDAKGKKNYDTPLGKLISYHKGTVKNEEANVKLLEDYGVFINEAAWHLTKRDYINCIHFRDDINEDDREDLWRLFLSFFKVLTSIVSKAEKSFQHALHGRRDHPPHIALFLAFVLLFRRYHQAEMNGLLAKHLVFYYRDVLRLQKRREIPDRVHIIFEIAKNIESHRLQKGTLLLGDKDRNGIDRLYALADELVVNQAKLVEKQNLYFYKNDNGIVTPIALHDVDKQDGIDTSFTEGGSWHPLSGATIYKSLLAKKSILDLWKSTPTKDQQKALALVTTQQQTITAKPGIILSSPELWMDISEGRRIEIEFNMAVGIAQTLFDNLTFKLSTEKGDTLLEKSTLATGVVDPNDFFNQTQFSASATTSSRTIPTLGITGQAFFRLVGTGKLKNKIEIFLSPNFPAITPIKEDKTNPLSKIDQPFVLIQASEDADYQAFKQLEFSSCTLKTSTRGLKNVVLQLGDIAYSPTAEIPLVGSTSAIPQKLILYATAPEIAVKELTSYADVVSPITEIKDISSIKNALKTTDVTTVATAAVITNEFTKLADWVLTSGTAKPLLNNLAPKTFENLAKVKYSSSSPYPFFKQEIMVAAPTPEKPLNIFKLPSESISINYKSNGFTFLANDDFTNSPHKLYNYDFLSGYSEIEKQPSQNTFSLVPQNIRPSFIVPIDGKAIETDSKPADGNLRLAFELLKPGQILSLLFHFADGTGNPDHIAPDEIVWSYLRQNKWVRIPPQYILLDETFGFRQTGVVSLQIPLDINSGNTAAIGKKGRYEDLFWLQASATENAVEKKYVDALPMLIDIYPQAGTAVFENHNNEMSHIENGLPPSTISQLRFRDTNVVKVIQPFASFDGRQSEIGDDAAYYRRISERLRHKQRAITVWDYERLTLEKFPKIAVAKCLPHTRDTDVERPNYVTLGVIPYPKDIMGNYKFYPAFNAGDLEAIAHYLNRHNSFFVSGLGGGVVCCCDTTAADCTCQGMSGGRLLVQNAVFEPVRLQVCIKFRLGKDESYYKKQLNEDLKAFLSPWATETSTPLLFGAKIYTTELLRFLENLDYVDVVLSIRFKHFPNRAAAINSETVLPFEEGETIEPFTSRSVLTTYLDILNEDNPNVIDHEINIAKADGCCFACKEKEIISPPGV